MDTALKYGLLIRGTWIIPSTSRCSCLQTTQSSSSLLRIARQTDDSVHSYRLCVQMSASTIWPREYVSSNITGSNRFSCLFFSACLDLTLKSRSRIMSRPASLQLPTLWMPAFTWLPLCDVLQRGLARTFRSTPALPLYGYPQPPVSPSQSVGVNRDQRLCPSRRTSILCLPQIASILR